MPRPAGLVLAARSIALLIALDVIELIFFDVRRSELRRVVDAFAVDHAREAPLELIEGLLVSKFAHIPFDYPRRRQVIHARGVFLPTPVRNHEDTGRAGEFNL